MWGYVVLCNSVVDRETSKKILVGFLSSFFDWGFLGVVVIDGLVNVEEDEDPPPHLSFLAPSFLYFLPAIPPLGVLRDVHNVRGPDDALLAEHGEVLYDLRLDALFLLDGEVAPQTVR